jgi:hypothetical protein
VRERERHVSRAIREHFILDLLVHYNSYKVEKHLSFQGPAPVHKGCKIK